MRWVAREKKVEETTKYELLPTEEHRKVLINHMGLFSKGCHTVAATSEKKNTVDPEELYELVHDELTSLGVSQVWVSRIIRHVLSEWSPGTSRKKLFKPKGSVPLDGVVAKPDGADRITLQLMAGNRNVPVRSTNKNIEELETGRLRILNEDAFIVEKLN